MEGAEEGGLCPSFLWPPRGCGWTLPRMVKATSPLPPSSFTRKTSRAWGFSTQKQLNDGKPSAFKKKQHTYSLFYRTFSISREKKYCIKGNSCFKLIKSELSLLGT